MEIKLLNKLVDNFILEKNPWIESYEWKQTYREYGEKYDSDLFFLVIYVKPDVQKTLSEFNLEYEFSSQKKDDLFKIFGFLNKMFGNQLKVINITIYFRNPITGYLYSAKKL